MEIIKAVILGIVEGITEFLPISSTGHLIIVNEWIHFSEPFTTMFDIVIQLGAIFSVVVYFWHDLWPFGRKGLEKEKLHIWQKTIIGVIPAIILGALLADSIEEKLFNPWVVAVTLFLGGVLLISIESRKVKTKYSSLADLPLSVAFYIGLIQCFSMIPGTSRAASTIIGAMILGVSRTTAVEYSFFLAIPTMFAATGYSLLKHGSIMSSSEILILGVGFMTAFVTALLVIRFFITYIKHNNFNSFAYYRIALAVLIVVYFLIKF